jgi:putative transcriptional regulator
MGLVLNKPLPLFLNDVLKDFNCPENIPIYKGGPLSTDTLFYLHTLKGITGALSIGKGFYLNGDFEYIKNYIMQRQNQILLGILRLGVRTAGPGN